MYMNCFVTNKYFRFIPSMYKSRYKYVINKYILLIKYFINDVIYLFLFKTKKKNKFYKTILNRYLNTLSSINFIIHQDNILFLLFCVHH